MSEWQPIETAPKDGTLIMGWGVWAGEVNGPDDKLCQLVISWKFDGRTDYAGFNWQVEGTDGYAAWMKPTHWKPLSKPPK